MLEKINYINRLTDVQLATMSLKEYNKDSVKCIIVRFNLLSSNEPDLIEYKSVDIF